jgi:hypothetical protein
VSNPFLVRRLNQDNKAADVATKIKIKKPTLVLLQEKADF